jgi:hypothetical protein
LDPFVVSNVCPFDVVEITSVETNKMLKWASIEIFL